jgi:hypothetical protein
VRCRVGQRARGPRPRLIKMLFRASHTALVSSRGYRPVHLEIMDRPSEPSCLTGCSPLRFASCRSCSLRHSSYALGAHIPNSLSACGAHLVLSKWHFLETSSSPTCSKEDKRACPRRLTQERDEAARHRLHSKSQISCVDNQYIERTLNRPRERQSVCAARHGSEASFPNHPLFSPPSSKSPFRNNIAGNRCGLINKVSAMLLYWRTHEND